MPVYEKVTIICDNGKCNNPVFEGLREDQPIAYPKRFEIKALSMSVDLNLKYEYLCEDCSEKLLAIRTTIEAQFEH